ncbi:AcrR family transcriptional regulator [Prauserella isguenensis]|uniref:AcrR family transcriptional regulator n=1 Tax=Prauserella isguenensis TaxID=1470180 RepID=A0A839RXJ6_9PSEU|nr:TetR/AcrR family transcriptional regulator C-terminal domain-containing protein [Prauserella isguenensis]MBB3049833.1 AcrR family transcriptional regulator [Prauserella isguenensis]
MSYWDHRRPVRRARSVDEESIARDCVDLLDEGGLQALTIRAAARRLGIAAPSLYTRVDSVSDLADLALDAALGDDADMARAVAEEEVEGLLVAYYRHLVLHPWACQVIAMRPPRGPHCLRLSERLVALLVEGGASDPLETAYALTNLVIGSAVTSAAVASESASPVDPAVAPTYARLHARSRSADPEQTLVAGIAALRNRSPGGEARRAKRLADNDDG